MNENFIALLLARGPLDPHRPCLVAPSGAVSYGALYAASRQIAGHLIRRGLKAGDRVAVQAPKAAETVMLYLAVLMAGGVYLPLNTAYTDPEVQYFLDDAEPAFFIKDAAAVLSDARDAEPLGEPVTLTGSDMAAIVYTSGTTGRSKGAVISHGALAANALALHKAWGFVPGDVLLHALPIYHIHGLFVALHPALLNGSALEWLAGFDPEAVIKALPRCTVMMGVPTFYTRLLAHDGFTRRLAEPLRLYISGSAPLHPSTFAEFQARTGHAILERYGMSEAGIITTNPLHGERIAGSVGFPLPGVRLRILGGGTGVIQIKAASLFSGYWRMPEKTREEFTDDGYFVTGDVGRVDSDGRLWISDRAKDLIISGGLNVYPREVELVLDALPGVKESAVIGVPHPDFGEAVVAVAAGQGDEAALTAAARRSLAAFKLPKRILFVQELPRNAMGKVQKAALRAAYAGLFQARTDHET